MGQFFEIIIVYRTLYTWKEDVDDYFFLFIFFFAFLAQVIHYLPVVKCKK